VFLASPTIEELQVLDMPILLDMLAYQTSLHVQLLKEEGLSNTTKTCKECIKNIQAAIEMKKKLEQSDISMVTSTAKDRRDISQP
jgi:hypothetical protein